MRAVTKGRHIWLFLLILLFWYGLGCYGEACEACLAGHGSPDERFNKPLANLRKIYEKEGRNALPYIRQALMKSPDPLVYPALIIMAEPAISAIEERTK